MWGVSVPPQTLPDEVWLIKPDRTGEPLKVVDCYPLNHLEGRTVENNKIFQNF